MTIYGESNDRFRPRPKNVALALFCSSMLLLALEFGALILAAAHALATQSRTRDGAFPLYAPFAQKIAIFASGPNAGAIRDVIAPLLLLALAFLVATIVPTATTLASRLGAQLVARGFALVALARALEVSPAAWLEGELSVGGLWRPVTLVGAAVLFHLTESKRTNLFSNFMSLTTPAQRLRLWLPATLLPLALVAVCGFINAYDALAFAALIAIGVTMLTNLSTRAAERYEKLSNVELREASATAPVVAIVVIGAALWLFGVPLLALRHRAVLLGGKSAVRLVPASTSEILSATAQREEKKAAEAAEKKKSIIEIHWSRGPGRL